MEKTIHTKSLPLTLGTVSLYVKKYEFSITKNLYETCDVIGNTVYTNTNCNAGELTIYACISEENFENYVYTIENYIHDENIFSIQIGNLKFMHCRLIKLNFENSFDNMVNCIKIVLKTNEKIKIVSS